MHKIGLEHCFDRGVCDDTIRTKKPNPTGVLSVLQDFGVLPTEALFVGDSSIDAATARSAGVTVWLFAHGYNMGQSVESAKPDRVVADFSVFLSHF